MYMDAGNTLRERTQRADAVAVLSLYAIRQERSQRSGSKNSEADGMAWILHSLKRPEEIELLRRIYGPRVWVLGVHAPRAKRVWHLAGQIAESRSSSRRSEFDSVASGLVRRDEKEAQKKFGQNVMDTFPMADFIVDGTDQSELRQGLKRFVRLIFQHPFETPTEDEQGMYLASSARLRSAAMGRQVGAAICREDGSVVAIGSNEVARPGGGQYWTGAVPDRRDFAVGRDSSDGMRRNLLADILTRLQEAGWLRTSRSKTEIKDLVTEALHGSGHSGGSDGDSEPIMRGAQFLATIDYVRAVHAEMAAICDAARYGHCLDLATLYTTTFPCHDCAKHILASGIRRVVYLDPYPKSLVEELHSEEIAIEADSSEGKKLPFHPFLGVAPNRYSEFFSAQGKPRKTADGSSGPWEPCPRLPLYASTIRTVLDSEREHLEAFQLALAQIGILRSIAEDESDA